MQISYYYVTPDDGSTRLHVCRVMPDGEVRFVLQIVQGIAERVERYLRTAEFFAAHGGAVIMHDRRGQGRSVPHPSRLGHCGDLYRTYRTDIDAVYASVYENPADGEVIAPRLPEDYEIPPLPRYLFGFSMGSLTAGLYAAESSAKLAGLILGGTPHREPWVSLGILGLEFLSFFAGEQAKPAGFNRRAFNRYNRSFTPEEESDGQFLWMTNDISVREAFRDDPVCNRPNSLGTYVTLMKLVRDFYRPASWNMDRRDLPILVCTGEHDPVSGGAKWLPDTVKFLRDMGYTDVRTQLYGGFRHEFCFDTGWEVPCGGLLSFVRETVDADNARRRAMEDEYQNQFSS